MKYKIIIIGLILVTIISSCSEREVSGADLIRYEMIRFCEERDSISTGGNLLSDPQPFHCCKKLFGDETCYDVNYNWTTDRMTEIK